MKKFLSIFGLIVIIASVGFVYSFIAQSHRLQKAQEEIIAKQEQVIQSGALTGGQNIFSTVSTSSQLSITTSSGLVLATSSTRQYVAIVNDGSNVVYLSLNNDVGAVVSSGIRLNASGGSYEINQDNLYTGAIRAIATGGTSIITITAKQ